MKENLTNHKFYIEFKHNHTTYDLIFMKKFVSQLKLLNVNAYGLNSNEMEELKNKLSNSNTKVSFFYLNITFLNRICCFTVKNKLIKKCSKKLVSKFSIIIYVELNL